MQQVKVENVFCRNKPAQPTEHSFEDPTPQATEIVKQEVKVENADYDERDSGEMREKAIENGVCQNKAAQHTTDKPNFGDPTPHTTEISNPDSEIARES